MEKCRRTISDSLKDKEHFRYIQSSSLPCNEDDIYDLAKEFDQYGNIDVTYYNDDCFDGTRKTSGFYLKRNGKDEERTIGANEATRRSHAEDER